MSWKIAEAKQNLSRLLRQAAEEPQLIYRRNRRVAAVIDAETFELFEAWREQRERRRSLAEAFAELRGLCADEDYELPAVERSDRFNPFAETTDEG